MKKILAKLAEPTTFVLAGALARIMPHPANFAPIAAMALFSGSYMPKKQALVIPLLAMFVSDLFIGFDSLAMRLTVYGSFAIMVFIGLWLKEHKNAKNIIFATLSSSLLFFVVTNFSVWAFGTMYPKSVTGLAHAYLYAVPFFRNTLLGDTVYSGVFFGGYELIRNFAKRSRLALES